MRSYYALTPKIAVINPTVAYDLLFIGTYGVSVNNTFSSNCDSAASGYR